MDFFAIKSLKKRMNILNNFEKNYPHIFDKVEIRDNFFYLKDCSLFDNFDFFGYSIMPYMIIKINKVKIELLGTEFIISSDTKYTLNPIKFKNYSNMLKQKGFSSKFIRMVNEEVAKYIIESNCKFDKRSLNKQVKLFLTLS